MDGRLGNLLVDFYFFGFFPMCTGDWDLLDVDCEFCRGFSLSSSLGLGLGFRFRLGLRFK